MEKAASSAIFFYQVLSFPATSPEHLGTPQTYGKAATLGGQGGYEPIKSLSGHLRRHLGIRISLALHMTNCFADPRKFLGLADIRLPAASKQRYGSYRDWAAIMYDDAQQ